MTPAQCLKKKFQEITPEYQKFLDLGPCYCEPFAGKTLLADGWKYRDLPPLNKEMLLAYVEIVGENNIEWLTINTRIFRGQLFLSSEGQKRWANFMQENKF